MPSPVNRDIKIKKQREDWKWEESEGYKYLSSKLLHNEGFTHGFFTKQDPAISHVKLSKSLNPESIPYRCNQVHGKRIVLASHIDKIKTPQADGLIGNSKKQSLWIYSADCIPVLIADRANGFVGACHAGWRGIYGEIIPLVINRLESIGSKKKNLFFALGPAISGKNYQVNLDLAREIFLSINLNSKSNLSDLSINQISQRLISKKIAISEESSDKIKLDIRNAAHTQIMNSGISVHQISICPYCTFTSSDRFNSWRRNKSKLIQWSGIEYRGS